ncbi:MAG: metallophosphoesterase family protein, partial [Verrucomicrobiales bacterium]|nr:metallophosphoesterase family protein [Verrucomicrobiales bacterium]
IPARWEALRTEANLKLPKLHSAPVGTFQYEAKLTGLQPAMRYYYGVFDGERRLTPMDQTYSFVTPPPFGTRRPIRFWVIGDSGTGRRAQAEVHQAMLDHVQRENRPLDFWLHVGDMAYGTGRDMEFQGRFFESYDRSLRSSVCWPAMGNHEGYTSKGTTGIGPYYDAYVLPKRGEAGGVASGTEAYYSFDYGNIHFICLDSHDLERKPSGAMAKWLKADLEKAQADWMIAYWHHPPYTKGSHDSDKETDLKEMRQHIMPIIESGGVDVVLTGHSHIYERSMLMDGAYATPTVSENVILDDGDGDPQGDGAYRKSEGINPHEGTVQVVTGHAGANLGRNGSSPVMKKIILEHGSVIVDVYGDTLVATMLNRAGTARDLFSIVKRGKVEPARLALPWQPPEYKKPDPAPKVFATAPIDYKILIAKNAKWQYLAGEHPRGQNWTQLDFDATAWRTGTAGFGFGLGEPEFRTELADLSGKASSLYIRKDFNIEQADKITELGLIVNYRDALIAYINGREVARVGVGRSSGRNAQKIKAREDRGTVYMSLRYAPKHLRNGVNVLAIETHTAEGGFDLCLDPSLILED